jgi:hypothetical protein
LLLFILQYQPILSSDSSSDSDSDSLLEPDSLDAVEESESEALFEKISGRIELAFLSSPDRTHGEVMVLEHHVGSTKRQEGRRLGRMIETYTTSC